MMLILVALILVFDLRGLAFGVGFVGVDFGCVDFGWCWVWFRWFRWC